MQVDSPVRVFAVADQKGRGLVQESKRLEEFEDLNDGESCACRPGDFFTGCGSQNGRREWKLKQRSSLNTFKS